MTATPASRRWRLLAALGVISAINMGFTYFGGNIMNSHMAIAMQLDRKSLGLAFGFYGLCIGMALPVVGFCVSRWGSRRILMAGSLVCCAAALVMGLWVDSMTGILLAYGLMLGIGTSMGSLLPAETLVAHWFRKRLALAVTLMLSGTAIGGFIAAPLFEHVIATHGGDWRAGWLALAASCLLSFAVAALFVENPPADIRDEVDTSAAPDSQGARWVYKTTEEWSLQDALHHPNWWLIVLGTVCSLATFGMIVGHGVVHFKDLGHDAGSAALFLAFIPLAGFAGKLVVGTLGDRVEPRHIWGGAMIIMSIGMVVGVTADSRTALYATAFLLGAGDSAAYPCMVTLLVNYFGKLAYASLMGLMLLIGTLASAIGSFLAGFAFDHFGSYAYAFYPTAAICLLAGLMMPFVKPPLRAMPQP